MFLLMMPLMGCVSTNVKIETLQIPGLHTKTINALENECKVKREFEVCVDIKNLDKLYKKANVK